MLSAALVGGSRSDFGHSNSNSNFSLSKLCQFLFHSTPASSATLKKPVSQAASPRHPLRFWLLEKRRDWNWKLLVSGPAFYSTRTRSKGQRSRPRSFGNTPAGRARKTLGHIWQHLEKLELEIKGPVKGPGTHLYQKNEYYVFTVHDSLALPIVCHMRPSMKLIIRNCIVRRRTGKYGDPLEMSPSQLSHTSQVEFEINWSQLNQTRLVCPALFA